jgi:tetratricopeptide (TPR) repeat protein
VLVTEDEQKFNFIENKFKERLKFLESGKATTETLFLRAELNLQRGFNFLNLGQELNAVWAIREAYNLTQQCIALDPNFIPIKKTSGVIQVMIGSVPDKFHWFMSLLGMKGSVVTGQKQLSDLGNSKSSLGTEANILYFTIKGFINQQVAESTLGLKQLLVKNPGNRLLLFLTVNMLMKNSESEEALKLIHEIDTQPGLAIYYMEYLKGEILLQRGEYAASIQAYQKFIATYKSQNFKKDSYYKIGLCYFLQKKNAEAKVNFETARKTGREVAEPDAYAAAQLKDGSMPNAKILKVRFYTDGGYYKEAKEALQTIAPSDLIGLKDQTEYYYRRARLAHKTNDLPAAKLFYQQAIDMSGQNPWYFAPHSYLQLGYIAQTQGNLQLAKIDFEKALTYKKHEYKTSVDSKAKSALEQLSTKVF